MKKSILLAQPLHASNSEISILFTSGGAIVFWAVNYFQPKAFAKSICSVYVFLFFIFLNVQTYL